MNHQHTLNTLSRSDDGYVGYCAGCRSYNVAYKNALFILSEPELDSFRQLMSDRTGMQSFRSTHDKEWLLKTPMPNFYLMFAEDELTAILQLIDEAVLLAEVNQILSVPTEKTDE